MLLFALLLAFIAGSAGSVGRNFMEDLAQAQGGPLGSAFLGGAILNLSNLLLVAAIDIAGMSLSIIASGAAGFAVSYGLGQGATLVAAFWGVFIWKEFKAAPTIGGRLLFPQFDRCAAGLAPLLLDICTFPRRNSSFSNGEI